MWRRWVVTVCGIVLMIGAVVGFEWRVRHVSSEQPLVRIVQPVRMLPIGTVIERDMIRYVDVSDAPAHALRRMDDVLGAYVAVPIAPDEPIASWKLSDVRVPDATERIVTFTDEDVATSAVHAGDVVDVWIELHEAVRIDGVWTAAVPVIWGLPVAAVYSADGTPIERAQNAPQKRASLTLMMQPFIYETFVLARKMGTMRLLRPNVPTQQATSVATQFVHFRDHVSWRDEGGNGHVAR